MGYIFFNNNPKKRRTGDCVIRAISFATGKEWQDVYSELSALGIERALIINDHKNWEEYLKYLGYEKQPMPKREDNTRYTIKEFCNELAKENQVYIVKIAGHLTVVKDKNVYDTWNCEHKSIYNYWIVK